jgi:phage/plasmid primase-like uncharacterized protein
VCRRGTLVSFFARGSWDSQSVCAEFIALTSKRERERTDNYQQAGETKCFQASDGDGTEAGFRLRAG